MEHPKIAALAPIDSCWLIEEQAASRYLEQIAAVDPAEAAEKQIDVFAAAARDIASDTKPYEVHGRTAIISLDGPMTKKPTSMSWLFGGASTVMIRDAIRSANKDKDVKNILLIIDSPGGQALGTEELANDVASSQKPITGLIDGSCCSAAYWVGSRCDKLYATAKTNYVGSVGTRAEVQDWSRLYQNLGVTVHAIATGEHKAAGTRGTPITENQLAEFKRYVQSINKHFVAGVAAGRGMNDDAVQAIATGQVWTAEDATGLGLIDGIVTLEEILTQLGASAPAKGRVKANHNPTATAPKATPVNKETHMNLLDKVKAYFLGNPEAAEEAGISADELKSEQAPATSAEVDPKIKAQLEALQADNEARGKQLANILRGQRAQSASAFADQMIREKRAFAGEREKIEGLFAQALEADGASMGEDGKLTEGASAKAVREAYAARTPHKMDTEEIAGADPSKRTDLRSQPDPKAQSEVLDMTPLGQRAKKHKEAGK